jgi:hypothetical protein
MEATNEFDCFLTTLLLSSVWEEVLFSYRLRRVLTDLVARRAG